MSRAYSGVSLHDGSGRTTLYGATLRGGGLALSTWAAGRSQRERSSSPPTPLPAAASPNATLVGLAVRSRALVGEEPRRACATRSLRISPGDVVWQGPGFGLDADAAEHLTGVVAGEAGGGERLGPGRRGAVAE